MTPVLPVPAATLAPAVRLVPAATPVLLPAAIFLGLNEAASARQGWAVPTATDIAFAVGVLALLGRSVPGNVRVLLLALAVAEELGVPREALTALAVELPGGRSRRLELAGVQVLDETYNASPEAMLAALDLLASGGGAHRYAVLGTMLELGDQSLELHRTVGERAAVHAAAGRLDGLVIVDAGAEGEAMQQGAGPLERLVRVATPAEALEPLAGWLRPGDSLLLKASRGVALEQLLPLLENRLDPAG